MADRMKQNKAMLLGEERTLLVDKETEARNVATNNK